ncbi:hypothetical protein Nepgr_023445 [Nepenthes gracilis]|uniref:Dolichyl-diphosphooligosaccharide--protein glycosyltransferase subunit KCP2 n=1 Tax=Nepenthes gracilis TaxID=150966 RepID=A0AAD3T0R1_NEPGR|nr:hypothetical protein Nepgr_023445 [Nepenthes gracilis]
MAGTGSSMLLSFLFFTAVLSLQQIYKVKLASSELFTILGGLVSALLFLLSLTFIGNYLETCGMRTGWGAVMLAESIALVAASTVHRVCITTCFLFSAGLLYEVNKLSGLMLSRSESKTRSVDELVALGKPMDHDDLIKKMIDGLDDDYKLT